MTALFALLGNVRATPGDATVAIAKLLQAIPATFRSGAERAAETTVTGASWGRPDDGEVPADVVVLQRAIATERQIRFHYRDRGVRELVPLIVASKGDIWYLVAAPIVPGEDIADQSRMRVYRLDRIRDVTVTKESGLAFDGFNPGTI